MKFKRQEVLATRFPTKIEKFINAIPTKETGLPLRPLPGWRGLPLYQKLPMYQSGRPMVFTRRKLGEKLWKNSAMGFIENDSSFKFSYEPLHDPNLKHFFYRSDVLKLIRRNGLIGDDNRPICSLRDFNYFRSYLRFHHVHKMKVAKEFLSKQHSKRRVYQHVLAMARREVRELKKQLADEKDGSIKKFIYNTLRHDIIFKYFSLYDKANNEAELFDLIHYDDTNKLQLDKRSKIIKIRNCCTALSDKDRLKQLAESVSIGEVALPVPSRFGELADKKNKTVEWYEKLQKAQAERYAAKKKLIAVHEEKMKEKSRAHYMYYKKKWDGLELNRKMTLEMVKKNKEEESMRSMDHAKIILEQVLNSVRPCLSDDPEVLSYVMDRVLETGEDIMFHYIAVISSILQTTRLPDELQESQEFERRSSTRSITFSETQLIGKTDTILDSSVELKSAAERTPTPIPSMESLMAVVQETPLAADKKTIKLTTKIKNERIKHLKRNDRILLEHCLIQFKRIVFMGVKEHVHASIDFEFGKIPRRADMHKIEEELIKKVAASIIKTHMKGTKMEKPIKKFIKIIAKNVLAGLKAEQKNNKEKLSQIKESLKRISC